jgi:cysteine desulfurase
VAASLVCLDANAGAPLRNEVKNALIELLEGVAAFRFGNPSSIYAPGRKARFELERARERVGKSLGDPLGGSRVLFTSSGTEAIQLALRSFFEPILNAGRPAHLMTTPVEHDATLALARWLVARGGRVTYLPIDDCGRVVPGSIAESFARAQQASLESGAAGLRSEDTLLSLIWVNNETGVIQPIEAIRDEAQGLGLRVHWDAAQAWGKLPIQADALGAAWLSLSAHKIGALPGTGVLWARDPWPEGDGVGPGKSQGILGKQESGRRGGTENWTGASAAGLAATLQDVSGAGLAAKLLDLGACRDALEERLLARIPGLIINGRGAPRVANTSHISINGIEKPALIPALELEGFAVSAGSACASGLSTPSHVPLALGLDERLARASLRLSLLEPLALPTLERFVDALERHVRRQRPDGWNARSEAAPQTAGRR